MSLQTFPFPFFEVCNPVRPLKAMPPRSEVPFSAHSVVEVSPLSMFLSYFAASSLFDMLYTLDEAHRQERVSRERQTAPIRRRSDTGRNFIGSEFA